jgi:hypothetical protein
LPQGIEIDFLIHGIARMLNSLTPHVGVKRLCKNFTMALGKIQCDELKMKFAQT